MEACGGTFACYIIKEKSPTLHKHTHTGVTMKLKLFTKKPSSSVPSDTSITLTFTHNELGLLTMAIQAWADTLAECVEDEHLRDTGPTLHADYITLSEDAEDLCARLTSESLKLL